MSATPPLLNNPPAPPAAPPRRAISRRHPAWVWVWRGLVVLLVLASLGGALYSVNRLRKAQRDTRALNHQAEQVSRALETLERKWTDGMIAGMENKLAASTNSLFSGPESITNWVGNMTDTLASLSWRSSVTYEPAFTQKAGARELTVQPVRLQLSVSSGPESAPGPYVKLLQFTRMLKQAQKRVDLVELNAEGASNSVSRATALLHLWSLNTSPL